MTEPPGHLTGSILGRYRVGALLGRGGMGEVYRAEDVELQRPVALKVLPHSLTHDAGRLARFVQEARAASALNHPHLVAIYEIGRATPAGEADDVQFIAMELVHGVTLRALIASRQEDLRRLLDYLTQAADALAAAHAAGIVHRDLKPDNVMVAEAGYAKVLDFGLAKLRSDPALVSAAANEPTVTRAGVPSTAPGIVMGTVGYMSPEQAQGRTVDHRSDIFSFGCILYEAATGTRPFAAGSAIDTLHQIIHGQPQPIAQIAPSCPSELQRIVRKCLAKNPDERYQSMRDLALDLRDLRRELESGSSPGLAVPVLPERPRSRGRWVPAAALLGLLALGAAAWWVWDRSGGTPVNSTSRSVERLTGSGLVTDAVISEDGKYIAYVEAHSGRQALFLRQRQGGRALQLEQTGGGFWGIAFNRDSSAVYYTIKSTTDPGTLFTIPVLGGSARKVVSGIDSAVTFSPDGSKIAYFRVEPAQPGASSLVVAGADGADAQPLVTKRPPDFLAPGFFVAPAWSPDGRWVAATVRNSTAGNARLSLFDAATGAESSFPHHYLDAGFVTWMPDGSGLVLAARMPGTFGSGNGGQLWFQPYPSGVPEPLTNDLNEYRNATITRDGRSMLTVASEATARLSLAGPDGSGERLVPEGRFVGVAGVAWAPDGKRIYYIKAVQRELQLWSMDASGDNAAELVAGVSAAGVAVSRDGQWIVYGAVREQGRGIWRANADGSSPRLLAADPGPRWIALAPDDSTVYFTSSREGSPTTYRVSTQGGAPQRVAALLERAAPSPDGRLLAGVYRRSLDSPFALAVLDLSTGAVVNAITNVSISTGTTTVGWTPDSQTLVFVLAERINLWKAPALGGKIEKLTNFQELWVLRFAVSPDGKTILFSRGNVIRDAVLISGFR